MKPGGKTAPSVVLVARVGKTHPGEIKRSMIIFADNGMHPAVIVANGLPRTGGGRGPHPDRWCSDGGSNRLEVVEDTSVAFRPRRGNGVRPWHWLSPVA